MIQRLPKTQLEEISVRYPDLDDLLKDDYSFIENYLPMSLDLLPNQRHIIEKRLKEVSLPMNEKQVEMLLISIYLNHELIQISIFDSTLVTFERSAVFIPIFNHTFDNFLAVIVADPDHIWRYKAWIFCFLIRFYRIINYCLILE